MDKIFSGAELTLSAEIDTLYTVRVYTGVYTSENTLSVLGEFLFPGV